MVGLLGNHHSLPEEEVHLGNLQLWVQVKIPLEPLLQVAQHLAPPLLLPQHHFRRFQAMQIHFLRQRQQQQIPSVHLPSRRLLLHSALHLSQPNLILLVRHQVKPQILLEVLQQLHLARLPRRQIIPLVVIFKRSPQTRIHSVGLPPLRKIRLVQHNQPRQVLQTLLATLNPTLQCLTLSETQGQTIRPQIRLVPPLLGQLSLRSMETPRLLELMEQLYTRPSAAIAPRIRMEV